MEESEIIKKAMDNVPSDSKIFISKLGDIAERVEQLLDEKGWSQKDLARVMGKNESEISKWLNNVHNFTLKSISKMEAALGADIIYIPLTTDKESVTRYVFITVRAQSNDAPYFDLKQSIDVEDGAVPVNAIKPKLKNNIDSNMYVA